MSSSTKRGVAPVAPGVGLKIPPSSSKSPNNGTGPPPLSYQSEPRDDVNMNEVIEENIELKVILPNGKSVTNVVDHSIPMLDLLIQLAVKNKVNPSSYTLVVISEETKRPIDYKANQTIGSIDSQTIRLVPKKGEIERITGKSAKDKKQPFEMTHRFTVNLPRNQKMVSRISSAMPLDQLFHKVCQEKNFNPDQFVFQHTANPDLKLDLHHMTVGDLKSNEINLVNCAMIDNARSMPDLSRTETARLPQDHAPSYMPGASEPKKKRGFLSFLKKDKKFKLSDTDYKLDSQTNASTTSKQVHKQLTPPMERRTTESTQGVRPKSMFVSSKPSELENGHVSSLKQNAVPKAPPRMGKKRPAPLPPSQSQVPQQSRAPSHSVEVVIKDNVTESQQKMQKPTDNKSGQESVNQRLHSRNSSDSSGYHELTLSGAESPEAGRVKSTFKTSIDTTSIESVDNNNDSGITPSHNPSLSNNMVAGDSQTLPLNRVINKPPRQRSHSLERKDNKQLTATQIKPSTKKKRAPAPPQPAASATFLPTHQEAPHIVESTSQAPEPIESEETFCQQHEIEMSSAMKFNEVDQDMSTNEHTQDDRDMMTERASLCSEDIDNILIVQPKSQRPCSFIAPPPPLEPPPDFSPSLEKEYVDKGVVVNDDNASLPPESLKGSPTSMHSRMSSQSSIVSVNTIEDVSLDFEQAIALGEEYLQADEKETGYKDEMAMFVQRMTLLTVGSDQGSVNQSDSATPSVQDVEESETGSIAHNIPETIDTIQLTDTDTDSFTESEMSSQSDLERLEKERQARISAIFNDNYDSWEDTSTPKRIGHAINEKLLSPDADNAISFDLPPPVEFQNDSVATKLKYNEPTNERQHSEVKSDEPIRKETRSNSNESYSKVGTEDDEEWSEVIEEVYHFGPSSSYTFGGAYKKIPDLETKKEPDSPKSKSSKRLSNFTYYQEVDNNQAEAEVVPREKEEFVLTTNDLANVNFVASPPLKNRNSKSSYINGRPTNYEEKMYEGQDNVKSRVSELSSSPNSKAEIKDDLEQKSISNINFPAMRESERSSSPVYNTYTSSTSFNMATPRELTPSGWVSNGTSAYSTEVPSSMPHDYSSTSEDYSSPRYQLAATTYSRLLTPTGWQAAPSFADNKSVSISPSASESMDESKTVQYEELEDRLKEWQEQLEINQNILASQQFSPENQTMQTQMQSQIEMQKQMMEQLQKSMSTLTPDATSTQRTPSPPSPPQHAFQLKKASTMPRPPVKRFEPKLDPREELMIAIRTFGGRNSLESVPLKKTNWK